MFLMRIFSGKTSPPKLEVEKDGIKLSVCIASIKVLAFNVVDLAAFAILLGAVLLPITISQLYNFREKIKEKTGNKNATSHIIQAISMTVQRGNATSIMGILGPLRKLEVLAFNVVDLAAFAILLGAVLLPIKILRL